MITAIALDDDPLALTFIKKFCDRIEGIDMKYVFSNADDALSYIKANPVDLVFLDIQMPNISGIDFYKSIDSDIMAIFTTSHTKFAIEGFNLNAVDYLVKPYNFDRFKQAVEKAIEYHKYRSNKNANTDNDHIFIRADYTVIKVFLSDIQYIEGLDNYLKIHLDNAKPIIARMSMKSMMEKLPEKDFIRVHRSYIIAINRIQSIRNKVIKLPEIEIPVGTNYVEQVQQVYKH